MRRREFLTSFGGVAVAWPFASFAQQGGRIRHVMIWIGGGANDPSSQQRAVVFRNAMRELGWIEGRNVKIDARFPVTNAVEETRAAAAELEHVPPGLNRRDSPSTAAERVYWH
jgi:putative ABC transport system substrate-binding protein